MNDFALLSLSGVIAEVSFYDIDSSFTIASVNVGGKTVTMVGYLKGGIPGEVIDATGFWNDDLKTGRRFYVESFAKTLPQANEDILRYLSSGSIIGLSSENTCKVVNFFGKDIFSIISEDVNKLKAATQIPKAELMLIEFSWKKHQAIAKLINFLLDAAISPIYAAPIYNKFGDKALELIYENPYILVSEIKGLNFLTAAKIAQKLGLHDENPDFVKFGLVSMLQNMAKKGHTYCTYKNLLASSITQLGLKPEATAQALAECTAQKQIIIEDINKSPHKFLINNKAVYLAPYFFYERSLGHFLKEHLKAPLNPAINLNNFNATHVSEIISNKITVVEGTGHACKCAVINDLACRAVSQNLKVTFAALNKTTACTCKPNYQEVLSIHELLGYNHETVAFTHNAKNKLNCDVLVIMQAGLIGTTLMHCIVQALPEKTCLILEGDRNHLLPHSAGNVLADIVNSSQVPTIDLSDDADTTDNLTRTARKVALGMMPEMPIFKPFDKYQPDVYFVRQTETSKILEHTANFYTQRLSQISNFKPDEIQIVTLSQKGPVGAKKLNLYLQEALNKEHVGVKHAGFIFKTGDRVVQTSGNLQKGVLNGQTGVIRSLDLHREDLYVEFVDQIVGYTFAELNELEPAYAISVARTLSHKYKAVIVPLSCESYFALNRRALYSAFLCASEMLIVVGEERALKIAVDTVKNELRCTGLKDLLCEA